MHTFTRKPIGWVTAGLLVVVLGCGKQGEMDSLTSQSCQLQSERFVVGPSDQLTSYMYNEKGQLVRSESTLANGFPSSILSTYTYDDAGKVVALRTQMNLATTKGDIAGTYEYAGDRLTKITSTAAGIAPGTTIDSYSYDNAGRIATYSFSTTQQQNRVESYTFTSGQLTTGTITRDGQSLGVTIADGRITSVLSPNGIVERYSYDANGYLTRRETLDKSGTILSYTVYEYSTIGFKNAHMIHDVVPTINLYGKKDLPESKVSIYNGDGSLKAETQYAYQINSKGFITQSSYIQKQSGVSGQTTSTTTYTYSNCQ